MATKEVKSAQRDEARGGLRIAKPQLAPLIMAAVGVAMVFSISIVAVIVRPLFVVRRFWAEFGMKPKFRP